MTRTRRAFSVLAATGAVALLAFLPGGGTAAVGNCTPEAGWGTLNPTYAQQVLQLVNQHRAGLGLTQLVATTSLTASAEWKSLHMAGYGYMAHNDPAPPVARSVGERLVACGYPSTAGWGENIAYGYTSPQAVMNGWLNSSGHRSNIENPSWRAIGIGAARSASGTLYWTQNFGTSTSGGSPPPPPPPPSGDTQPPTTPGSPSTSSQTTTTVTLRWTASTDNVGVTAYGVYANGSFLGTVSGTGATVSGLQCGTTYAFGVDARDAAGNKSGQATLNAATSACSAPPPPSGDTQAPTTPGGLAVSATRTSLTLSWAPSTDNVGVAGYRVYRSGSLVATVSGTSGTLSNLSCGRWYSVGVQAFDAAGNASGTATRWARTASC